MNTFILDASAILALMHKEEGAAIVASALKGSIMSSVNYSEVVAVLARKMQRPTILALLAKFIPEIIPFDSAQGLEAGFLYHITQYTGLSLGDRACIALAKVRQIPILTADTAWTKLDLGVHIICIR